MQFTSSRLYLATRNWPPGVISMHECFYNTGKPSSHPSHVDYIPTVFSFAVKKDTTKQHQREKRYQQLAQKRHLQTVQQEDQSLALAVDDDHNESAMDHVSLTATEDIELTNDVSTQITKDTQTTKEEKEVQTEATGRISPYGSDLVEGDDAKTKFYTGLPSWAVFMHVFTFVVAPIPRYRTGQSKMTF